MFLREKNSDILQFRFKNHQVTKVRLLNETLNIKEIYDEEVERYPIQQKNLFSLNFVYKCDYFLWWIVEMSHIWKFVHAYSSFADLVNLQTPFSGWRGVLDYRIPSKLAIPPELHLIRIDSNWFESIQLELRFLRFFEYSVQLELEKSKFIFIWIVIFLGKYSWKFTWIFIFRFMNIHCEYSRIFGSIRVKFDKIFAKLEYF